MESVLNDKYFRLLSDNELGDEWEGLATHLDFRQSEIAHFKNDNKTLGNTIFAMLYAWGKKQTKLDEKAAETLMDAFETVKRQDLAKDLREKLKSGGQVAGTSNSMSSTDGRVNITNNYNTGTEQAPTQATQEAGGTTVHVQVDGKQNSIFTGPISDANFTFN